MSTTPNKTSKVGNAPNMIHPSLSTTTTTTTTTQRTARAPSTDHESTPCHDSTDSNERELDEVLHQLQKEKNIKIFESKEMTQKRRHIICEVEKLTTSWIQGCLQKNESLPQSQIDKSSSYICAFGSYELNVHFESSDIDLLCIGPRYITRDMLFTEFVNILETDPRVTDILQLRHAFVPLLKFSFEGIDIDLVYAQWDIAVIDMEHKKEEINVFSSKFIKDQETLYSLNGVRSTQTIKKLIPNKCIFEKTLRIIKFWAQQRAIYSNVMGFLGGISWSIMTALICIQHPNAINCVEIIRDFFAKYKDYDAYHTQSICLDHALYDTMYDDDKNDDISSTDFMEYTRNEFAEIMPILTPARPSMNCAYNVIESTKSLIIQELRRGYEITTRYDTNSTPSIDWNQLFSVRHLVNLQDSTSVLYEDENVYIRIQCVPDPTNLFSKKWTGFIESKIRNLVKKLNRELFDSTFYPYSTKIKSRNIDNFFIAGRYNIDFDHRQNNEDAINLALQQFQHQMDTSSVRCDCGFKCQLKLDVYRYGEMHALLSSLQDDTNSNDSANSNAPTTTTTAAAAIYPQYNLLQQIQLMNITTNAPPNTTYHTAHHTQQPPPPPLPPRSHPHSHHRHPHHHRRPHHHRHHPHHAPALPPRHQHRRTHGNYHRTRSNNNAFMPSVYHHGTTVTPPQVNKPPQQQSTSADTAMESVVETLTPKVTTVNDDEERNKMMDDEARAREDSDSNESLDGVTCTSSSDSNTHEPMHPNPPPNNTSNQNQNNNNNLMCFQVPNMSNISSFPIIKIQQNGLPHLPPFVSTQNGHSPPSNEHYPFITNQNANHNNSSGWIHKILLEKNNNMSNNSAQNKVKPVQTNSEKQNTVEQDDDPEECIFDDKENKNTNVPKSNFIPHRRVKIPDAFVSDLNVMESEQFGYPSPNTKSNSSNGFSNAHCDKSTLIIHPALSANPSKANVNIKNNANRTINCNNNINNNVNQSINNTINVSAPINININNQCTNGTGVNNNTNAMNTVNGNVLNAVLLQQALTPNVVSFNNTNDSNSELMRSYQNYCKILNVFKINDNTKSNNTNVNNNNNNNNNNVNNVKMCNSIINNNKNTTVSPSCPVSIGYSSGSGPSNSNGSYNSDSSTTHSPNHSPNVITQPDASSNPNNANRLSDEESNKPHMNPKKPLYSVITATAPSVPPNTAPLISLSSGRGMEPHKQQRKAKKRWNHANYHPNSHHNHNNNNNATWNWNEVVAPAPFSRFNNNANNKSNEHRNDMYYYKESNTWRLKLNNGNNYRNYAQNHKKRHYSNAHRQRPSF